MSPDENQYRLLVENSPGLIWRSGQNGSLQYVNQTWLDFTGQSMDLALDQGWSAVVHPEDLEQFSHIFQEAIAGREPFAACCRFRRQDGVWRQISSRAVPYDDDSHQLLGYVGSCLDITGLVPDEDNRLQNQTDALTGLSNRRQFLEKAAYELERADRFQQNLCVAMLAINGFEDLIRQHGRKLGDELLIRFARSLRRNTRKFDLTGRYGDNQFAILYANTDLLQADLAMKRLCKEWLEPVALSGQVRMPLTFSFGFAVRQQDASLDSMLRIAEKSMCLMNSRQKDPSI